MSVTKKRLSIILGSVILILLIPLVAMQFTTEVDWSPLDFLVMGALLLGLGLTGDWVLREIKKKSHRILLITFIFLIFLLVWVELAVGIFGTPFAGS